MRFALKRRDPTRTPLPESLVVEHAGRAFRIGVKRSARARRLILRIDPASGLPVLSVPPRASLAQARAFLGACSGWIESRLSRAPSATPFRDGASLPLRGEPCRIAHRGGRGLVRLDSDEGNRPVLSVPGAPEHLPRRVADWLKREARRDLEAAVASAAAVLGKSPKAIRIGDARSRWGSCSSRGVHTFSWRLILAPSHVLDYLAAHEVAHLAEMNHGPRFWALVERLDPEHAQARAWLKANGAALHRVGRDPADASAF
jgi:predicted metal-dependent hydrolase